MTPRQVAILLTEKLGHEFLVDPQVDVEVKEFRSQWVMVTGQAQRLGRITLRGGTRLKEVLSEAGGFAEDAGEKIIITRKDEGETLGYRTIDIDRRSFESGDQNPVLVHGDIITISRAEFAFVHGEVAAPGRVRIERGITLLKAIASMGGFTDWANKSNVQILQGEGAKPRVYNVKKIQAGKVADPELYGGEIIVVKRRFL